jgi:hypothetical protein
MNFAKRALRRLNGNGVTDRSAAGSGADAGANRGWESAIAKVGRPRHYRGQTTTGER